jgi:hypothetical protein
MWDCILHFSHFSIISLIYVYGNIYIKVKIKLSLYQDVEVNIF